MGLRERKKAKTRKMISDMATLLFIERGYDNVTVAEIAQQAEISVPTLFNYFPNKESLVFDEDEEREARLVAAIVERKKGQSILDALLQHFLDSEAMNPEKLKHMAVFRKLIESTPDLANYSRKMWMRYEHSVATAFQKDKDQKMSRLEAEAIAHFILDAILRSSGTTDPKASLKALFKILKEGVRGDF